MPEPMRFWELMSAFRKWPEVLRDVLASEPWGDAYFPLYQGYSQLVARQDRHILDAPVPWELSRAVAAGCPDRFAYEPASSTLHPAGWPPRGAVQLLEMTALEVHDRFGGSAIEEVYEYGSAPVIRPPAG